MLESEDHRFFNAAVYLEDGEVRHIHRKVYLPTYGMFDEQRYFARGGRLRAFDTRHGRLALLICEDLWHPSTVHLAALDGALTILCPSSSPLRGVTDGADQDDNARYWELITRSYAETYGVFVVHANRVGFEDGVGFWGGSGILDPFGRTVCKADLLRGGFRGRRGVRRGGAAQAHPGAAHARRGRGPHHPRTGAHPQRVGSDDSHQRLTHAPDTGGIYPERGNARSASSVWW